MRLAPPGAIRTAISVHSGLCSTGIFQWGTEEQKVRLLKPLAEGTSKGVHETSRVTDRQGLTQKCLEVLKTYHQPALVETFLPGREFTVGLLGGGATSRVIGVAEVTPWMMAGR